MICLTFVALASGACDKSTELPNVPPVPVEIEKPDFTGTLEVNGAVTTNFRNENVGTVTMTVKSIEPNTPDLTKSIGIELGVSSGTNCQRVVSNDNAGVNAGILASANGIGELCARVYDPGGAVGLTETVTFVVGIKHY